MSDGYRDAAQGGGARVRADVVECHVVRRIGGGLEVLSLRRTREPLRGTWQPVFGHCEQDEGSVACVVRELREEIGLEVSGGGGCEGLFALEQVRPFYVWRLDAVVLGPRFVVVVNDGFEPTLNGEHDAARWMSMGEASRDAHWPGQRDALAEIAWLLSDAGMSARETLRVRF
jgi:8-oxo-dGTP pyrophosphatase MutT (NUDIX family)